MTEEKIERIGEVDKEKVSPMMRQYIETKTAYMDCVLFYRLGDFYEMFFEDAVLAGRELELTLTGKNAGLEKRIIMCGIPFHSYEGYMTRLVDNGHKVAICEQVEDPKLAKGIVQREVVRIVTPGTNTSAESLDESRNNYIVCIYYSGDMFGLSACDVSTGDFYLTECKDTGSVTDEIERYSPKELIYSSYVEMSGLNISELAERLKICRTRLSEDYFDINAARKIIKDHFRQKAPVVDEVQLLSCGAMMKYLYETQKNEMSHITNIETYIGGRYMLLDNYARRNLELTETLREKNKRGSLLWVLDKTKTAMGARMLRSAIELPLLDKNMIEERLDAVEELTDKHIDREEIREYLAGIYDLERLAGRISYRNAGPKDLIAFLSSVKMLKPVKEAGSVFETKLLRETIDEIDTLDDLCDLTERAIVEDPPFQIKEGGIIREGFNAQVDELRSIKNDGKNWLLKLEERERENTGIKILRIRYNKVFGYYFEVTNSFLNQVPKDWVRKQTLTGGERFTTPELKELEDKILHAEDRLFSLEYDLFNEVRETIASNIERILKDARAVAKLDWLASIAYVSERNSYVRPQINDKGVINITNGRHPVVEQFIGQESFIGNDTYLDNEKNRVAVITGPNMAGKSTYMRQTALIVLMAQCGCYVPADAADIGICDRIFTRVGASDDLAMGQSTFMVEMTEVAHILKCATKKSLLILDEIWRGTSTFDGLGIAWSVVEYICDKKKLGAKTLFATHYHELTELEDKLDGVNNYCIAVKEQGEDIIFLRKIIRGGADRSYGIQVARLAGLPKSVLDRAKEIVNLLADNDINTKIKDNARLISRSISTTRNNSGTKQDYGQMSLFWGGAAEQSPESTGEREDSGTSEKLEKYENLLEHIKALKIDELRPVDAINVLAGLQEMCR